MRNQRYSGLKGKRSFHSTDFLLDTESGLYIEDYFHEMVALERKRSERSGRPFLLMLIDIKDVHYGGEIKEAVGKISSALASLTRETDVRGWHEHNFVIGVIFTEIMDNDVEPIKQKVLLGLGDRNANGPPALDQARIVVGRQIRQQGLQRLGQPQADDLARGAIARRRQADVLAGALDRIDDHPG